MSNQPTALPPFSGDDPTCPKCGNKGALTRYRSDIGRSYDCTVGGHPSGEHLDRSCTRCDYEWPEATVTPKENP